MYAAPFLLSQAFNLSRTYGTSATIRYFWGGSSHQSEHIQVSRDSAKVSMKNVEFVSKRTSPQQEPGFTKINSFPNYTKVRVSSNANTGLGYITLVSFSPWLESAGEEHNCPPKGTWENDLTGSCGVTSRPLLTLHAGMGSIGSLYLLSVRGGNITYMWPQSS